MDPLISNTAMRGALTVSPGCDGWVMEEVYGTSIPTRVKFVTKVALDENFDLDELSNGLEGNVIRLV